MKVAEVIRVIVICGVANAFSAFGQEESNFASLVIDDAAPLSVIENPDTIGSLETTIISASESPLRTVQTAAQTIRRTPSPAPLPAAIELDAKPLVPTYPWLTVPYTVNVLTASTLEERQVRNITESLERIPGVMVQKTANGQGSPYIRGFTGYRTLAVVDGIRYNNSIYRDGPSEYFSLIDHYAVDSIHLIQGPGSVAYGSDAIGGTLSIQTKSADYLSAPEGESFSSGEGRYRWSSAEQSHQSRLEMQTGVGGKWGFHLGGTAKHFGNVIASQVGEQRKTGYDEWAYDARFDHSISDSWKFTAAHQMLSQDDVWRTHSTIFGVSFAGSSVGSDLLRLKDQQRSLTYARLAGTDLEGIIDAASLTLSFQNWQEDGERIRGDGRSLMEAFDSKMWGIDLQMESDSPVGRLTYGADYYEDHVDTIRFDFNPNGTLARRRIQGPVGDDSTFGQSGAYLQDDIELTDRIDVSLGGRYSHVSANIGRFEDPATGNAASFSGSRSTLVGSARAVYDLTKQETHYLFGGISESFRAPNLADLSRFGGSRSDEFESAAVGLVPESFLTYELGVKSETKEFSGSVSAYRTELSSFITSTPTGRIVDGLREVTKQNSSTGYVQGAEASAEYRFDNGFSIFGNIAWVEGEADVFPIPGSKFSTREPLSRIQPVIGSGGLRWQSHDDRFWVELSVLAASTADRLNTNDLGDTQRISPGGTPGYSVFNLHSGWEWSEKTTLFLGIENIFDKPYRTHGSGSNEPGVGVTLGINQTF